jgi:hypothetical protein
MTLLSKIKWKRLDAQGFQLRHEEMHEWRVEANTAFNKKLNNPEKFEKLCLLLSELVRKTSAETTLEVIEKISELFELPNPAIKFCTEAKLSGTFGIRHIVSVVLITFVPRNFTNNGYIRINFWNWKKLRDENTKVWTKRFVPEGEYF